MYNSNETLQENHYCIALKHKNNEWLMNYWKVISEYNQVGLKTFMENASSGNFSVINWWSFCIISVPCSILVKGFHSNSRAVLAQRPEWEPLKNDLNSAERESKSSYLCKIISEDALLSCMRDSASPWVYLWGPRTWPLANLTKIVNDRGQGFGAKKWGMED